MTKEERRRLELTEVLLSDFLAARQAMADKLAEAPSASFHEAMHWEALHREYRETEAWGLLRCARNLLSFEVARVKDAEPFERTTLPELLPQEERILVVGAKGSGKSALVARVVLRAWSSRLKDPDQGLVPFVVPVELLEPGERLDIATLARLSPAAGRPLIEHLLAERLAVVVVDGLDRASDDRAALLESISTFARAHPGNRFVATTRPFEPDVVGAQPIRLPDFTTVAILAPARSSRVHPAHRFLARRTPARKAALFLEHVYAHQEAWSPSAAPLRSVLYRLSREDQGALCVLVATQMHEERSYELATHALVALLEPILWSSEDGETLRVRHPVEDPLGSGFRPAPHLASELVAEIRERPGPLCERRKGWFAFADFALQEVLVALTLTRPGDVGELVVSRGDPWWHGVIELTAGLRGKDAAFLVSALLAADPDDSPAVTMLAARCAEATSDLPEEVRRTVEARLSEIVPPQSVVGAERLAEVGDVGAPLLLRALMGGSPAERALSALVLGRLQYEPACSALLALSTDTALVDADVGWPFLTREMSFSEESVGLCALAALFGIAQVSGVGQSALRRAMNRVPLAILQSFCTLVVGFALDPLDPPSEELRDFADEIERVVAQRLERRKRART